jgi:hypothetical protein
MNKKEADLRYRYAVTAVLKKYPKLLKAMQRDMNNRLTMNLIDHHVTTMDNLSFEEVYAHIQYVVKNWKK